MPKKTIIVSLSIVFGVILSVFLLSIFNKGVSMEKVESNFEELEYVDGERIVIEQDEFDFYYGLVRKGFEDRTDEKSIHNATSKYIQDVYSQFLIGNHLGVSDPYSFQSLKSDMEQENNSRKLKVEKDEVFYGPEEFQLEDYLKYSLNKLKNEIIERLSENPDKEMVESAKKYLEDNPNEFSTIQEIQYETTTGGVSEKKVVNRQDMSSLEKTNSELFEKLYNGEEQSEFEFEEDGKKLAGKIISKKVTTLSFEKSKKEVMENYIAKEVYDNLVSNIGERNPIKLGNLN